VATSERIDLGDGDWWDIRAVVTRGMRKKFRSAVISSIQTKNGAIDLSDSDAITEYIRTHMGDVDLDSLEDAYLLHGTVSFHIDGKTREKVDIEVIDAVDDTKVEPVLSRMHDLYGGVPEEAVENLGERPQS
jgi:hypothetical protein